MVGFVVVGSQNALQRAYNEIAEKEARLEVTQREIREVETELKQVIVLSYTSLLCS